MNQKNEFDFNKPLPKETAGPEVIDLVKKLLRMKNGGTEAEVETALRMAQRLADEYNINLAALDLSEQSPLTVIVQKPVRISRRGSDDESYAAAIIKRFFNVDTIFSEAWDDGSFDVVQNLVIVGTAVDAEVAQYVFEFLNGHFKFCWRKRPRRIRNRRSFIYGVFRGLHAKLSESHNPLATLGSLCESLVLSRQAYLQEHFPNLKSSPLKTGTLSSAAANVGYQVGRRIDIRPGVGDAAINKPLQLTNGK
jgi:hypothetical protein